MSFVSRPGSIGAKLHGEHRVLRGDVDGDAVVVEFLRRRAVEVAQREGGASDETDASDFAGISQFGDEVAETVDDAVAVKDRRHAQTLANVSRQTSTPRSANASGTSDRGGTGSAGSTSRPRGSSRNRPG